ncbi:MAG TPA: S49 family peptidase [Candidatus Limnocylindrales bacterium]|nr:S49 family peptidase [Candidatus Limnocylindrales bacterium]
MIRRALLLFTISLLPAAPFVPPSAAGVAFPHYSEESSLLSSTSGTDDGAVAAMLNPAQWGLLERSEAAFWWSDRQPLHERRDDYGFSMGRGVGISYRHRIGQTADGPRGVGDYQIGLGWTDRMGAAGIAYGFSGPGRSAFGRSNFVALGRIIRPTSWLSLGSATRLSQRESQGVVDLGVRPLSDPRLLLFADYAIDNHQHWDDGDISGGVALKPIPGLEVAGKWSKDDRFQLTLGLTVARTGFRSLTRYDHSERGATNFAVRMNPPVRGMDPAARFLKGRRFLEMDLKGEVVYQSYRYLDGGSLTLRRILDDLSLATLDPTVGGVAINLSGMDANIEMVWEIREKLLDLRRAGKKSVIYIDRPGGTDYYLASAADRVIMDPMGMLFFPGVATTKTYMKDALEKLGIGFEEWRYFKYKSALEQLSRRDMSEADREQRAAFVKATYEELAAGITESGRMTRAQFDSTVNEEPALAARRLLELHWIDEIGAPDALREAAKKAAGRSVLFSKPGAVRSRRWQPDEFWGPKPTIALVYAIGECAMDTGIRGRETSKALKRFRERRNVKAVVVRADSPGGDPLASDLVAREMKAYRDVGKPLYVSQGRVAGSGGYWISMNAARITASPFTITGSIGVIGGWAWNEGIGKKLGLASDHVQMGKSADLIGGLSLPLIGLTIPERNLTDHERVMVKRGIFVLYDDFTQRVAEGRAIPVERVREIAQGHVYAGRDALQLKLVDEIASLDRTIEEAKAAAGIRKGRRVRIEEYPRRKLFPVPRVASFVASRLGGAEGDPERWSYEQKALGLMLRSPGVPLLLTPASLLPDEPAAR